MWGGNIGKPLLPDVSGMEPEDFAVLELSSFQLMTMEQSPHIAVMTNLSPTTWTTTDPWGSISPPRRTSSSTRGRGPGHLQL